MPTRLSEADGVLRLKISESDDEAFRAALARAKSVPGRRYNPDLKCWDFPDSDDSLLKAVFTIEPDLTPALENRVRAARESQAEELLTKLPDDAPVSVPWQARLAGKQRAGIDFMADHPHTILADDMGAGKTVQSISAVYEKWIRENGSAPFTGRVLVIAPNSVVNHWRRELHKWLDTSLGERGPLPAAFSVTIIDGKNQAERAAQIAAVPEGGWCLINWEKLRKGMGLAKQKATDKQHPLNKVQWYAVIADEVHRAKNKDSQQSKALQQLRAPVQIGATGTPVMNNPGELFALLSWLRPEQYTSFWQFHNSYTEYYEGYKGKPVVIGVKNPDALRFELSDKMVRRTKREIHPDIPEPFEPIIYEPEMTKDQRKLYESAEKDFWLEVVNDESLTDKQRASAAAAAENNDLNILRMAIPNAAARTLRLRQIATSPATLPELEAADSSGKLDTVVDIITSAEEGRPFVCFTWFKASAELLRVRLADKSIDARTFTGDNDTTERSAIAEAFQAGEFQVIILTIAVGGVGINLHRASDCIFVEEDWVPGINNQAFDRVDRKGQTQHPQRHIVRSNNSVDTGSIATKLATKKLITDALGV